ncbi:flocculation protein FLO11-like [Daphnia pulex]|uniref:flocculation protein FLO11-like n=1 Tax=Daphnia pulex TaxID=6669 RepID=UPI001EDFCE2B|nr:flocculation protein FLO11-like [Daphnia pulex]
MLSSKLKSWMESHLTRKKSSGSNSKKSASGYHGGGGGTTTTSSSGSYKELSPADRIAHPASSLVNLVPAVPLCSTSGRSNAGLVIRLQNDFREQQHSSAQSPCHLVRHQQHHHHPSWTRSPVMLAWNTKIPPPTPTIPLKDPPISPPPSSSSSTIIQQSGEPSPTGSDWTSKSFADESGIGGSRTDNREGSLSSSSKANTTTGSSIGTADFPHHHHHHESRRMNAPSLSSPESAYSTGCSADGVSPSQDGMFDANFNQPLTASAALLLDPVWRRSTLEADASGSNSTSSTQSPRTRPAIRTNPWLPVRTSLTSAGSTTGSDRVSWMTDSTPEAALSEMCPPPVKETDIVASSSSSSSSQEEEDSDPVAAAMAACAANDELDQLCDSLQLLMDGDRLRVITASGAQPMKTTVAPLAAAYHQSPAPDRRRWEATAVDVDDQYTLLIRQTEEILLQLEKDELLLASRKNLNQAEENELSHPAKSSSVLLHPVVVKGSNSNNNNNSRPCSASSASGLQPQRRRLRKTAASRRRCSSSSRNSALVYSSSSSSSSESSDCEYLDSNNRRMLLATTSASDWNASRRPRSVNRNNSFSSSSKGITPRFASRQNVRVLPHPQQQQQQQPLPVPARDCWILSSQRTSCSPDDWTTEHDRPPSPAPLDPHCHWSSVAHPSVQLRNSERMMTPTRSPSISSCSSNSRRNSRQFRDVRHQQTTTASPPKFIRPNISGHPSRLGR